MATRSPDSASPSGARTLVRNEEAWKKNVAKKQRNLGLEYESLTTKRVMSARHIGEPCTCRKQCFEMVGRDNIERLFKDYWGTGDWNMQNMYLQKHTTTVPVRRRRTRHLEKRRESSRLYHVTVDGKPLQVCKQAFARMHGIGKARLDRVQKMTSTGVQISDQRGRGIPQRSLIQFPMSSSYCSSHLIEKDDDIVDCGEDGSESNSSRNHEEQDAVNPLQDVDDISTNRTKSSQDKIWDITEYGESADEDNSNQGGESHSSVNMELMNGKIIKPPRVPINQVPVLHYTFNQMNNTVTSEVLPLQLQNPSHQKTSNTPKDPSPFSEQDLLKRMSPDSNFQPIAVPVTASLTLSSNSNQPDVNNLMATGQPQPQAIAVPVTASLTLSSNNNQTDVNNLMATGQPELRAIAVPVTASLALSSNNNQTDVNNLMTTGQPQLRAIAVPVTAPLTLSSNSNQPDVSNLMATGQPQLQAIAVPVTAPLVHPFHNNYPHATNLTSVRQSQLQPIAVSAAAPLTLSSMPTNTFIQQQQMPREEEELYGSYVAAAIRKMSNRSKSLAKMRIQQVIFELEEIERETQT